MIDELFEAETDGWREVEVEVEAVVSQRGGNIGGGGQ